MCIYIYICLHAHNIDHKLEPKEVEHSVMYLVFQYRHCFFSFFFGIIIRHPELMKVMWRRT